MEYGHAFGVDHLTYLAIPPPEWVELAWSIGFDMVGIRLRPMSPHEDSWPMSPGSQMLRATAQRLSDLDIKVLDVEILSIDPQTTPASYRPIFEAAAMLQALHVLAVIDDPDEGRAVANLAELSAIAANYGMRMVIEPMSYTQIIFIVRLDSSGAAGEPLAGIVADFAVSAHRHPFVGSACA
jgi:sugar phosphate isomerase/epimerase